MTRILPSVGIVVATYFVLNATSQFQHATSRVLSDDPAEPRTKPTPAGEATRSRPAPPAQRPTEPAHKAMIRCLTDLDNLLDTVQGPISFAAVKPKLLARVRRHAAEAKDHPNPIFGRLSQAAALELQRALNRHAESLSLAIQAAPEVKEFFEKELAPILSPNDE